MNVFVKKLIVLSAAVSLSAGLSYTAYAQTPGTPPASTDVDMLRLATQVDVLRMSSALNLKEDQISLIIQKIDALKKKYDDMKKQENTILLSIKEPLQKIRDAMVAGKEPPAEALASAEGKRKALETNRENMQMDVLAATDSCTKQLTAGQLRMIARSPEAVRYASQLVTRIRQSSEQDWPQTASSIVSELVQVKLADRQDAWQARADEIAKLTGDERGRATEEFDKQREAETADLRVEAEQLLNTIRNANQQALPFGVDRLAVAVRSQTDVQAEAFTILGRIIDSPGAQEALKDRLDAMKAAASTPAKK